MSSKSSPTCLAPSPPAALGEVAQAEKNIKSWQILSIFECFAISPLLLYTDELVLEKELSPPSHCSDGRRETGPGFISPDSFGTQRGTRGGWICEGNEEEWGLGYVPEQFGSASRSPVVTENIHGLSRAPGILLERLSRAGTAPRASPAQAPGCWEETEQHQVLGNPAGIPKTWDWAPWGRWHLARGTAGKGKRNTPWILRDCSALGFVQGAG